MYIFLIKPRFVAQKSFHTYATPFFNQSEVHVRVQMYHTDTKFLLFEVAPIWEQHGYFALG